MMSRNFKTIVYRDYAIQCIYASYAIYHRGNFIIEMPTMTEAMEWIDEN